MGIFGSGPWLVDDDGNDVFDSVNSPTESAHIFDPINVENSLDRFGDGAGDVGAIVDDVDDGIRGIGHYAGGHVSEAGGPAFEGLSEGVENDTLPGFDPEAARDSPLVRALVWLVQHPVITIGGVLFLYLAPLLTTSLDLFAGVVGE